MNAQRLRLAVQRVFARNSSEIDDETKVFSWEAGSSRPPPVGLELGPDELPVLACFQGSDSWVVLTTERITLPGVWSLDHAEVDAIKAAVMVFGEADDPHREVLVAIDREHNHYRIRTGSDVLVGYGTPFWHTDAGGEMRRSQLELDTSRLGEAVEAWVPVITPQGRAVLVWPNCD